MDRSFYSKENIREMNNKGLKFLLPLVFTTRKAKQLVYDFDEEISKPICSFLYNENVYSYVRTKVEINGVMCVAHIFLDKERRAREESLLIRKMSYLESIFSEKDFKDEISAEEYIKVKKRNKRVITIERDEVFLKEAVMEMGKFIFITNERGLDRKDVLSLYRSRDGIERLFRSFKHNILEKRSRVKSSTSMKGSVFINFLALILISHIYKIMNQEKLYKKVTKKELFRTLDQLKVYHLANDKIILAEVSKCQKEIFSAFKLLKKLKPSYN